MVMHADRVAPEKTVFSARPAAVLFPAERKEMRVSKLTYADQLKDPRWQRRRLEIMQRDEFRCQVCMATEFTLHVHHKYYTKGRKPWEYEDHELVTLCVHCHEDIGYQDADLKDLLARLRVDGPFSLGCAMALVAGWASVGIDGDFSSYEEESPHMFLIGQAAGLIDSMMGRTDFVKALVDRLPGLIRDVGRS